MTAEQLTVIVREHGMSVDGYHGGAGLFRDLEIGVGFEYGRLINLKSELAKAGVGMLTIERVNNPDHEDYGKHYLAVGSFWWE